MTTRSHVVDSVERLLELYPNEPVPSSIAKESPVITPGYRQFIEASPFCVVATVGSSGLDQSPRGDAPGFVTVHDEHTLVLPDRRGNNRLDTLRNLVADPRVGLIFLVPGSELEVRVRGTAVISADPDLLNPLAVKETAPVTALVVTVHKVYFQCARAVKRSRLWDEQSRRSRDELPTAGQLARETGAFTSDAAAAEYDAGLEARQRATLY